MDKETEFSSTFEFLIPQNELVYGPSFVEAMNECFLTFGRHVASWRNITWATLISILKLFTTRETKERSAIPSDSVPPRDGFDMTEPVIYSI